MSASILRLVAPARAIVARPVSFMAVRSFTAPSAPMMKDILKELYIKELQGYKPAPEAKGVDASQVKDFKAPLAPQTPVVDAAADLAAWETANVEVVDALTEEADVEEEEEEEVEEHHH
ncbi:hypothetical protein CPC16_003959 [Podila verticillata]|nr:hypothetical protein CPC16_003959 [Podila verticillata]KAI9235509.1 MAG: hypothetical protein BYD32DRAFT_420938 [Podila humilis]KFH68936.1 hypothetical protein MVEG_05739 [Podila verticillata NRRL 6337]